jgi:transcriptional regulator with XRE-family HTH domain
MAVGSTIQAWRIMRRQSVESVAAKAGLEPSIIEAIESGEQDPSASRLETIAAALGIPAPWLHVDPSQVSLLTTDGDGDDTAPPDLRSPDPVVTRILAACGQDRRLYVLLTALLQGGEPKLLAAAEASLRSLVKQSRQASVPWQSRPPGHFEPPSD